MLRHISYRLALPIGHTLLDVLLASVLTYHGIQANQDSARSILPRAQAAVAYSQESQAVTWDPPVTHAPLVGLLLSGTLPAGIAATTMRRNPDAIWLAIHEVIAIPLWLLIGSLVDGGRPRLGKWMRIYLFARFLFAVLGVTLGGAPLWSSLQGLFWISLGCYGFVRGMVWLWARLPITSRPAS